jgi:8-oxo-dGTP pyrophosphatase MutT (NUDIX family)
MTENKKVTCRGITGETKEFLADDLSFRPSVYGVVIKDSKILLVPQWDGYDFPGGGVDLGETLIEAVKREVEEETGLPVIGTPKHLVTADAFFLHPSVLNLTFSTSF